MSRFISSWQQLLTRACVCEWCGLLQFRVVVGARFGGRGEQRLEGKLI